MQKEILRVYCPKLEKADFPRMRLEVQKALSHARGSDMPIVILFSEIALKYQYEIRQKTVAVEVLNLQSILPPDRQVIVAFNVLLQSDRYYLANTGYFFTHDSNLHHQPKFYHQPKRVYTQFETFSIKNFRSNTRRNGDLVKDWDERGTDLGRNSIPFCHIVLDSGYTAEYRICLDVASKPLYLDDRTITVVSAKNLEEKRVVSLLKEKKAVIVNDSANKKPTVKVKDDLSFGMGRCNGFYLVSILEEKSPAN